MSEIYLEKEITIGIIGLGYVGLPLALLFNKKYDVIGFDLNTEKIEQYKNGIDVNNEIEEKQLIESDIFFTNNPEELSRVNFFIVAVPTPIKKDKSPDLSYIISATKLIASHMNKDSVIVYESTVFPGVTEDICIPLIEEVSGYTCGEQFNVGYSPERISPGDKNMTIEQIIKIVSGHDKKTLEIVSGVYSSVLENGVYEAPSIKVAEAAKITENIQRDVNIALMNELSIIFSHIGIDTNDVIDAAATKWNFTKYTPGLVGGHCIGVDPYYLIYESKQLNYSPRLLQTSRRINEDVINHILKNLLKVLCENNVNINKSNILLLGLTYKENCSDIRNSKIVKMIYKLNEMGINTTIYDPLADAMQVHEKYDLELVDDYSGKYDAIILTVAHDEFKQLTYEDLTNLSRDKIILFDLKSLLKYLSEKEMIYWSL